MTKYKLGKLTWIPKGEWYHADRPFGFQPTLDEATLLDMGAEPITEPEEIELPSSASFATDDQFIWAKEVTRAINSLLKERNSKPGEEPEFGSHY